MADIYDHTNFGMSVISEYTKDDQDIIAEGIYFGWTLKKNKQSCVLESYDRTRILEFSTHRRGQEKRRPTAPQKRRMLARFADPTRVAAVIGTASGLKLTNLERPAGEPMPDRLTAENDLANAKAAVDAELAAQKQDEYAILGGLHPDVTGPVEKPDDENMTVLRTAEDIELARSAGVVPEPTDIELAIDPMRDMKVAADQPIETPMLSHYARGTTKRPDKTYLSESIIQRDWPDGHRDFKCAYELCTGGVDGGPYVSDRHMSVASHRKAHVRAGVVDPETSRKARDKIVDVDYTTVVSEGRKPRAQLTSQLLTAEQVLDQIRELVDLGKHAKMQAALVEAQDNASHYAELYFEVQKQLDESRAEVERLQSEMLAFRDLFDGAVGNAGRRAAAEQKS